MTAHNPAPTMLTDYQTPALVIVVAAAVILYFFTDWLIKRMHANSAPAEQTPEQAPPPFDDTCFIDLCHRPGIVPAHTVHGIRFVCRRHSGQVGDWVGHDAVYDQDLDPATDIGQWEKEMPA